MTDATLDSGYRGWMKPAAIAGGLAAAAGLAWKLYSGDVDESRISAAHQEPQKHELALEEAPKPPVDVKGGIEKYGASQREDYTLDHSNHDAFMNSFADALEAGERDVYLKGNVNMYKDFLQKLEGVEITDIEEVLNVRGQRGYKVHFESGQVLGIVIIEDGEGYIVNSIQPM